MSSRHFVTTTLKLEACSFSDQKIYPGKGRVFISRDGRTHIFSNKKNEELFCQKKKPVKLRWTQAWRRANKKATANVGVGRKKHKSTVKTQKAIVGLSLDELMKRRAEGEAHKQSSKNASAAKKESTKTAEGKSKKTSSKKSKQ